MQIVSLRWVVALLLSAVAILSMPRPARPDDATNHVAIQGYDVVSYFTDGKPVKGSADISMPYDDSKWQFANASHKKMFAADPDHYMPQYGGACAGGMAMGVSIPANPENWVIVDGKLYMVAGTKVDLDEWKAHAAENIATADQNWKKMQPQ